MAGERARRLKDAVKAKLSLKIQGVPPMPPPLLGFLDVMCSCILEAVAEELDRELEAGEDPDLSLEPPDPYVTVKAPVGETILIHSMEDLDPLYDNGRIPLALISGIGEALKAGHPVRIVPSDD